MDVKIENQDIALKPDGEPIYIDSVEETAQRVKIACSFKKGSFIYDRKLGYNEFDIDFNSENAKEELQTIFKEASADVLYSDLKVLSLDKKDKGYVAKIEVYCGTRKALTEVIIIDNL